MPTPTYFPFRIGAIDGAAVSAGSGRFRVQAFFANAPSEALAMSLARHGIRSEKIATPFNCLLIRHADGVLVVDTGTKPGTLTANLKAQGIVPEQVRLVVLSHAHPDHTRGAFDSTGRPTFPNARHLIARPDYERARATCGRVALDVIEPGDEILTGVRALSAPGHTPGQVAVQVQSQGETLLYTSDVIAHPIHLEQPGWNIISDADPALALRTRTDLLSAAADAGWWLFVYHFPFPGLCRIARDGQGWRIVERPSAARPRCAE